MKFNPKSLLSTGQISVILSAVIGLSLVWSTVQAVQKNYDLQQEVDQLEEEISILELKNDNLKLSIAYFESDEYLELEARQKFNKAGPNEGVLLLPKDGDGPINETPKNTDQVDERSNFEQWRYFLFGRHNS